LSALLRTLFLRLKGHGTLTVVFALAWLGIVGAATFVMALYANTGGANGTPPARWPEKSGITRDGKLPTLVMFVHPRCPCSKASLGELALLMAHCQGRVNAHVLFLKPEGMDSAWTRTGTWTDASRIPGVLVQNDDDGREAKLFHVETSGDTALYDANGNLLFHGGITSSRGHSGDNTGRNTLQADLLSAVVGTTNTPVFGCSLFGYQSKMKPE
jgi:hypothetical protein